MKILMLGDNVQILCGALKGTIGIVKDTGLLDGKSVRIQLERNRFTYYNADEIRKVTKNQDPELFI